MNITARNWLIALVVVVVVGLGIWMTQANDNEPSGPNGRSNIGRAVFGITDASVNLDTIQSVVVTVDRVEVKQEGEGWVTLSDTDREYDLLKLKESGLAEVLVDANLTAGEYDQVRLVIKDVKLTAEGQAETTVKIPSNQLVFNTKFLVEAGETTTIVFDFLLDESIHITGNGKYIITPVVQIDTRNKANIAANASTVDRGSGNASASVKMGMDVDGTFKDNFVNKAVFELVGDVIHARSDAQDDKTIKITVSKALELAKASGKVDMTLSVQLTTQNGKKVWVVNGLSGTTVTTVWIDASTGAVIET